MSSTNNTAANKQYLEIQKEQIRITDTLNLLKRFYRDCKKDYARVLVSDYLKEKSLPHQISSIIQSQGIVRVKGAGPGKTFLWATTAPTEEMAEKLWREAVRIRAEYEVTKARERRGQSPNRVQVGNKQFIRLIKVTPDTPASVLKRQPVTVTEVNVMKMLKIVKVFLTTGQHVMDFASLCFTYKISTKWEKAMLKTVVGRTHKGFEWIESDDIDYDMVRKVIDTSKTISDVELDIPTEIIRPSQEIKSEFEKVIEKTGEMKIEHLTKKEDENSRTNQRLFRLFSLLQELNNILNSNSQIRSLSSYCRKYNMPESLVKIFKDANLISKTQSGYQWIGPLPSPAMAEQMNDSYNKRYNIYTSKKSVKVEETKSVSNNFVLKTYDQLHPKETNVLVNILNKDKDEKKEKIMKLAEKFTKAGNYEMAEQLLDQLL